MPHVDNKPESMGKGKGAQGRTWGVKQAGSAQGTMVNSRTRKPGELPGAPRDSGSCAGGAGEGAFL